MTQERATILSAIAVLLCIVVLLGACAPARRPLKRIVEGVPEAPESRVELGLEDGLPGESYAVLASDGAWCWFGDPRAVFHEGGEHRRTFVGFVTASGDITVAAYDHGSGDVETVAVKEELQTDDHASPAIMIRPDGRLVVVYCGHRGHWLVYRTSSSAGDISEWGRLHAVSGYTSEVSGYTYPNPVFLKSEGVRYVFWRGADFQPMFSTSETGMTWSEPANLISREDAKPYLKVATDGAGTMHFALTNDHPDADPLNSIYYFSYRDGAFRRADGSVVGTMEDLPLSLDDVDLVYDAAAAGARAWVWDLAFEPSGNPVVAYAAFPTEEDHRYRYARWDGTAWHDTELTAAGSRFPTVERYRRNFEAYYSGGIALDHSDPSIVYLSRPVDGVFELERWTTPDGGLTWTSVAVTSGSVSNNVRPLVPIGRAPGGPELLWMNGPYHSFTDYSTSLRMK